MTPIKDFAVSSAATGFDEFLRLINHKERENFSGSNKYYGYRNGELEIDDYAWTTNFLSPHEAIALLTGTKQLTEGDLIVGNQFECIESDYEVGVLKDYIYCCENKGTITTIKGILIVQNFDWFNCHFKLLPTKQEEKSANQLKSQLQVMNIANQILPTQESVESQPESKQGICLECGKPLVDPNSFGYHNHCSEIAHARQPEIVPVQEEVKGEDEIYNLVYDAIFDSINEPSQAAKNIVELTNKISKQTAQLQQQLKEAKGFLIKFVSYLEDENMYPSIYKQINQFLTRNK